MPQINIEYDKNAVSLEEIKKVSAGIQKILSDLTPGKHVFVNAKSFDYSVNSDSLEILISLSEDIVEGRRDAYLESIVLAFKTWKVSEKFTVPTNIVLIPMDWDLRINV